MFDHRIRTDCLVDGYKFWTHEPLGSIESLQNRFCKSTMCWNSEPSSSFRNWVEKVSAAPRTSEVRYQNAGRDQENVARVVIEFRLLLLAHLLAKLVLSNVEQLQLYGIWKFDLRIWRLNTCAAACLGHSTETESPVPVSKKVAFVDSCLHADELKMKAVEQVMLHPSQKSRLLCPNGFRIVLDSCSP